MTALRLAMIVSTYPPYRGGMGNAAAQQARLLAEAGHDVHVYAPNQIERRESRVTVHSLPIMFQFGNAAFAPLASWVGRQADVVILHYPFFGGVETWALGWRSRQQKFIVFYHHDAVGANDWRGRFFAWHRKFFLNRLLKQADLVLVSSRSYAEHSHLATYLSNMGDKFCVLPFSVDAVRFSPRECSRELLAQHHLDQHTPIILFVGSLDNAHYFKGVPVLLRAFQEVQIQRDVNLLVVGDGDLRAELEEQAQTLGLAAKICFAGSVDDQILPDYYALADFLVFPSTDSTEAFGLVALEAMASGKAVIASNLPGVASLVRHNETGLLVEPNNQVALTKAICSLLDDVQRCTLFGQRARKVVLEKYSEEKIRLAWSAVITSL